MKADDDKNQNNERKQFPRTMGFIVMVFCDAVVAKLPTAAASSMVICDPRCPKLNAGLCFDRHTFSGVGVF